MAGIIETKVIKRKHSLTVFQQLRENIENKHIPDKRKWISHTHIDNNTLCFFDDYLSKNIECIVVEYPYSDKEYLSSVYAYYIKATKPTIKECYRLHFYMDGQYMGYIVLRPTPYSHIGRIQMHPKCFIKGRAYISTYNVYSNVVGEEEAVPSFSFTKQDPEVAMCAQVTLWAVLEYFFSIGLGVNRIKIADVTNNTMSFLERKIPAKGLTANNIMEVLNVAGLYPILKSSMEMSSVIDDEIFAYLDSGLPVIGLNSSENHAICLIGHSGFQDIDIETIHEEFDDDNQTPKIIMACNTVSNYIANDDNFAPYQFLARKCTLTSDGFLSYTATQIDTYIIPLAEKMFITYENVYQATFDYLNSPKNANKFPSTSIVRIFLTRSNRFKSNAKEKIYDNDLCSLICHLNMSTYIWCVEISSVSSFKEEKVDCLLLFDSTRHSNDLQPWLLIKDLDSVSYFNGESFSKIDLYDTIIDRFNGNLEEYIP